MDLSIIIHDFPHLQKKQLTGAKSREWMGMGVAGILIHYGSFPHY